MLDNPTSAPAVASLPANWLQSLCPDDIVFFRFPTHGSGRLPQVGACLMIDTVRFEDDRYAILARGTGAETAAGRDDDIELIATKARAAGLNGPTRFAAARRMLVALDNSGLVLCTTAGTPVVGYSTDGAYEWMDAVRACVHAAADTAAGRRPERCNPRQERHRCRNPLPVRMEHRYPRRRRRVSRG